MAIGPGKYDALCTFVREQTGAEGVIVIVFGGKLGSGFSCQADGPTTLALPALLEDVARQIRESGPFDPGPPRVHILHHGLPLCRFSLQTPDAWPKGHRWVGIDDFKDCDCQQCLGEHQRRHMT